MLTTRKICLSRRTFGEEVTFKHHQNLGFSTNKCEEDVEAEEEKSHQLGLGFLSPFII